MSINTLLRRWVFQSVNPNVGYNEWDKVIKRYWDIGLNALVFFVLINNVYLLIVHFCVHIYRITPSYYSWQHRVHILWDIHWDEVSGKAIIIIHAWPAHALSVFVGGFSNWAQLGTRCHYGYVIMGTIASQITSLKIVYSTVYSDADQRKHQSSASLAFFVGNSPGTGEFPTQMASNAENVSIQWRHHAVAGHATTHEGWPRGVSKTCMSC